MSKLVSVLNVAMFFVFLAFVAVQYNDPDPYLWMPMYGAAALACWLRWRSRPWRLLATLAGLVALVWALTILPDVLGNVSIGDMFSSWHMITILVEEEREMFGLLIVATWMGVLLIASRRRASDAVTRR
jgi:hypothetical protein